MDTKLKIAITSLLLLLVTGTIFYKNLEHWSWTDSFYFTSITLTTIGYGDIAPVTQIGKLFTAFFAIFGVAITLYALTIIATGYFTARERDLVMELKEESNQKNEKFKIKILESNKHLANVDKHIGEVLRQIDARIKK